ncbi:hypothetical protein [Sphingomonas sp. Mn802worker]|uniref:hypothetical protein n=1 Tax=Sphingomonas sp. Mn802worker TaxID=629773 RepID=UPI00036A9A3B|nr:hypothetical protein [Sphingomonas sp. Mn802worker]
MAVDDTVTVAEDARALVAAVREAARRHNLSWNMLVPDRFTLNHDAEEAEEAAYAEMAATKRALRDHICTVYGISVDELASLATP